MRANIQKILVPTDFSATAQRAFSHALFLADQWDASIELIHTVFPEYVPTDLPVFSARATKDKIELANTALKSFTEMGISLLQMGYSFQRVPRVTGHVEIGSPVTIINRHAKQEDVDLIVMGTKGTHNRLEKTLGSVTTGVIRGATCSVWVIPEHAPIKQIRKVAYAAEMRESDPFYLQKAMAILPSSEVELHVLHVQAGNMEPALMSLRDFEHVFAKEAANTKMAVHELEGTEVTEALDSFVETNEVDLLMMFAPEHTMIDRLFHRSTTKRMALETHIPLLLIKRQDPS